MNAGRTAARLALLATAIAVIAWLALAISVLFGAFDRLGGDASAARGEPATTSDAPGTASPAPSRPASAAEVDATAAASEDASGGRASSADASDSREGGTDDDPDASSETTGDEAASNQADDGPTDSAIVNWPDVPDAATLEPVTTTAHFTVTVADAADGVLMAAAQAWASELEPLLSEMTRRVGHELPNPPVAVVFARAYEARCPARGLASPGDDVPLLMVMLDEDTSDVQIRAVLAHEIVHHLTYQDDFVGDSVLTEGVANWGAGAYALAWQDWPSWQAAARSYLADGTYVSVADDTGQVPRDGEDCLARRDRVYNVRAAFVGWLVTTYGRDTVLAMPAREVPDPDDPDGEPLRVPDYEAATGLGLVALERRWLAELTGDAETPSPPTSPAMDGAGDVVPDALSPTEPAGSTSDGSRP